MSKHRRLNARLARSIPKQKQARVNGYLKNVVAVEVAGVVVVTVIVVAVAAVVAAADVIVVVAFAAAVVVEGLFSNANTAHDKKDCTIMAGGGASPSPYLHL